MAQLIVFGCVFFVAIALFLDARASPRHSSALWIAVAWVSILASRPVVQWFDPSAGQFGAYPAEGNPFDRNILTVLMLVTFVVLARRRLDWGGWIWHNRWLVLLFAYFAISTLWSDYPDITFKRFIRALGGLSVALLILSEKNPVLAIAATVRRSSLILIPLSLVLIKYFRHLGVSYNRWTGEEYLAGVTTDKNALGRLCLVAGLFAVWHLFSRKEFASRYHATPSRPVQVLAIGMFGIAVWLLDASKSSTSLGCFALGVSIVVLFAIPAVGRQHRYLGCWALAMMLIAWWAILAQLPETIVAGLGRNMTFTDRTYIWADLLDAQTDPLVGTGYSSFWLGPRLDYFLNVHKVNEAHSGYLDVYVELGFVGVALFSCLLVSTFFKVKHSLAEDPAYGRLRLALLAVFLAYNFTESAYQMGTLLGFMFVLIAQDAPRPVTSPPMSAKSASPSWRSTPTIS
jgi:exopolysaccharide production protein ExoQ